MPSHCYYKYHFPFYESVPSATSVSGACAYRLLLDHEGSTAEFNPRRDSGKGWTNSGPGRVYQPWCKGASRCVIYVYERRLACTKTNTNLPCLFSGYVWCSLCQLQFDSKSSFAPCTSAKK